MNIFEEESKYFLQVYQRIQAHIVKGNGVYLYDDQDNAYLDFLAGIAVNALGYNHPVVLEALKTQAEKNLHLSNYFIQDIQVELAKTLIELTGFDKIFFSNSGTEAIEGLIKLCRKWGKQNGKKEIIAFEGGFHGRTVGALTLTGQEKYQKNFQPLLPNIKVVPHNNPDAFNSAVDESTCAVFFEGITGEGGIRALNPEMVDALKKAREKYGLLLIADEIQTGVGRTGRFYYYEFLGFKPDAIATAKGVGGGLPLGAFLVDKHLINIFDKGEHGTTYGGNPLACATGLATVKVVKEMAFLECVAENGAYFKNGLRELQKLFPDIVQEVRGQGLMLGVQVSRSAAEIVSQAFEEKFIFNISGNGTTLRFVPPLIVEKTHIDIALEKLSKVFTRLFK